MVAGGRCSGATVPFCPVISLPCQSSMDSSADCVGLDTISISLWTIGTPSHGSTSAVILL